MSSFTPGETVLINQLLDNGVGKTIILSTGSQVVVKAVNAFDTRSRVFKVITDSGEQELVLLDDIDMIV